MKNENSFSNIESIPTSHEDAEVMLKKTEEELKKCFKDPHTSSDREVLAKLIAQVKFWQRIVDGEPAAGKTKAEMEEYKTYVETNKNGIKANSEQLNA